MWRIFTEPYRRNPKAAVIEGCVVLVLNGIMLAINVLVIGLPFNDMVVVKLVTLAVKAPVAPQYYALRDVLYAKRIERWWQRMPLDMLAWGAFQSIMYSGVLLTIMAIAWSLSSTSWFVFPMDKVLESVAVVLASSVFLAGPVSALRDPIKQAIAPDPRT